MKTKHIILIAIGILSSILVAAHNTEWTMHEMMDDFFENGNFDAMHEEMIKYIPEDERDYHENMHETMSEYGYMPCHG